MITYALDFETRFDDECSVRVLGNRGYFSHPRFDAYMVAVVGDDGYAFCGHPKDFDWKMLEGHAVISWNASFDESLYLFGVEHGWYPKVEFASWDCAADMAAYFSIPRALKNAYKWLYGEEMSKETRDNMKGLEWSAMSEEFKAEVTAYAIKDSENCLRIWNDLSPKWPEVERKISRATRVSMRRGLPIDSEALDAAIITLKQRVFDAESLIPWAGEKKLLSPIAFAEECRKYNIEPPASMAIGDEECDEWMERFGETLPFAAAVRNYRRINALLKKLEAMEKALDGGRYYGGLLYCGANNTKRDSGSGGNLNLQNLPRGELFGVDIRSLIRAKEGKKLVVVDMSQIEIRTAVWLSGDTRMMDVIRDSDDIYEAFGIAFGLWSKEQGSLREKDPALRQMLKCVGLGACYGASAEKIAMVAKCPLADAQKIVRLLHKMLNSIVRLWKQFNTSIAAARRDGYLQVDLPSGNSLIYRNVRASGRSTVADVMRNGRPVPLKLWAGLCLENASQHLARDIFMHSMLRVEDAGYPVLLRVHDELVIEVDEDRAQQCLDDVVRILSTPPEWINTIALSAEGKIMDFYAK